MKKVLALVMFNIAMIGYAQTPEIKEENGNVGIGTSTPATKLEIKNNEYKQLLLSNHGTEKFYLGSVWNSVGSFISNNSFYAVSHAYTALDDVANGIQFRETGDINFFSNTGLTPNTNFSPTSRLSIKSNGNVAIGIQTAKARLHVASNNTGQGDSKINMDKYSVFRLKPHASNSTNMQFAQVNNGNGMGIQVTNSGSTANWDIALNPYGGNIGIGTVAPQSKLEVHHSGLRSVHINPQNQLDVTGNSSITIKEFVPSIEFQDSSDSSSDAVAFVNGNRFYVGKKTGVKITNSSLFNVGLNDGYVGVGTNTPSEKLHVNDGNLLVTPKNDNESSILRLNEYRGGSLLDFSEVGDAGLLKVGYYGLNQDRVEINGGASNTGAEIKGFDNTTTKFQFKTNGSSFLNGGNVGIGKTTPTEKLHIEGNLLIDAFEKGNESGIFFREGFSQSNKYNLSILAYDHNGSSADGLSVNGFDGISFSTGAGTRNERMRIKQNGNVGIGTIETGNHRLAVEGSIGAREIKVEATGWSDFVFEREYKLPTLKEVENHIKEKGHLKDIPSEAEVLKNGFYLGEMDSKLLQKIEELTLYTIQQEKELKNQKEEIAQLKKQNKELLKLSKEIELIKQKLK
uniref:hypothetical protein n=1 Tax=Tenacibaculum aiptasiae TaxID=426481 RepID=UPI00233081D6|nr:hypothetical protein [Tenacibaculum aiptasiae]